MNKMVGRGEEGEVQEKETLSLFFTVLSLSLIFHA